MVDDLSSGKKTNVNSKAQLHQFGIEDPKLLKLVGSFKPELISHCAAQSSVAISIKDPERDAEVNIAGGINVCKAAIHAGCSQFIYLTTGGALYGIPEYLPCDEEHPIKPISPYGLSKWALEQYLHMVLPSTMAIKVLRLANVYGPRQDPDGEAGVVAIFGGSMLSDKQVMIFGDGEQARDFVYVGDVVDAHNLALGINQAITVNIGSGTKTSINELFKTMSGPTSYTMVPKWTKERVGEIKQIYLDSSRAYDLIGWRAKTVLIEGIRKTLRSLRKS